MATDPKRPAGKPPERLDGSEAAEVTPLPASTVVLVRDTHPGIEVLLIQRHAGMGFMGGMHVFPGGKVHPSDACPEAHARIAASPLECVWGADVDLAETEARALAAIRETFEEAGVLLGTQAELPAAELAELRSELLAGAPFPALLELAGVTLALTTLCPLSRWITPASERMRFDTSFYVARAPAHQQADHDRGESVASAWLSPEAALASAQAGRIRLAPPTALTLESFLPARSVADALALAASRPPPTVLPILLVADGDVVVVYPGDPEHPAAEPVFPGPTRRIMRRK